MKNWISKLIGKNEETPIKADSAKVARFHQLLPEMGENMEWKDLFGIFDEAAYERFKQEAKTSLPEDFEAYLRAYNGGIPLGVSHGFGFLFSMQTNEMEASLLSTLHWPLPPGKENWLPIGRDGAMGLFFMSLNKPDFGSIHSCFAYSDAVTGEMTFESNLHQVADCFSDMFSLTVRCLNS